MATLDDLIELKRTKLLEEKELADSFNQKCALLESNSKMQLKNLSAAIAASKRPGYFLYHAPPEEVSRIERERDLRTLSDAIIAKESELDELDREIARMERKEKEVAERPLPSLSSLDDWFATYGKPTASLGLPMTEFIPSSKVHGGSRHFQAFKSRGATMKRGRLV
eukprot:PLAT13611.1.p1 GENE.PLAT13611.1~~PLAT13611.1.p1  ORF type:complete len:167 (-),score=73.17 PLAT13611.1:188-688(-)